MAKLQILSVFLTERLTLAAQEIFKAVEDIFSEYNDEICRSRQEIELLRKRLQQAGLQLDSETHSGSYESQETQTLSEEQWTSEQDGKDTEVQMKLEVYTQQEENERVHMSVYNESSTLLPCMDSDHDQMVNKDIESQIMDSGDNDFPFMNQAAEIKNEPGLSEKGRDCQVQRFMRHSSDDLGESDASSVNTTEVINIDSPAHRTHAFHLAPRTQERMMQHRMELAQIRERLTGNERKKAAAKARSLKHKLKIYGNPELLEEYRKKERERYQRRKSQGKVKFAKDLSLLELRTQQKKWRERSAAYRRKKTFQEVLNNMKEDVDIIPQSMPDTSSA